MPASDDYAAEMRGDRMSISQRDSRVSAVFQWCAIVLGGITTSAAIWGVSTLVQVKEQMAILIARPEAISKEQYIIDQTRVDARVGGVEARIRDLELSRANALPRQP